MALARVNPEVAYQMKYFPTMKYFSAMKYFHTVVWPASSSHSSLVTCFATRECFDLISGKADMMLQSVEQAAV